MKAVDHVDLALGRGEIVGLAGESGCGKSTLALGSCRLLRPPAVITSGSVIYRGSRLPGGGVDLMEQTSSELRRLRWREISVVFQSAMNALNPVLRVRDQLGDAIDAHLKLRRGRSTIDSGSCSTWSAFRASVCAATPTSSPEACASG